MGATNPTKIHLVGSGRHEEGLAAGAITPGHLIKLNTNGEYVVHDNVQSHAERAFAVEDALQGRSIADAYARGEWVSFVLGNVGDVVYGFLAGGELAHIGDFLTSDGHGCLQVADDSDVSQVRLGIALEQVDQTESDDTKHRIKVRLI